ncbi:MAG: hypothetical protein Fur0034_21030 [Desulfuromonadia bacterium]
MLNDLLQGLRIDIELFPLTASVGVAFSTGGEEAESFLKRADRAMYRSKDAGKNRITVDDGADDG